MKIINKCTYLIILILVLAVIIINVTVLSAEGEDGIFGDEISISSLEPSGQEITARGSALVIYNDLRLEAETIYYNSVTGEVNLDEDISLVDQDYQLTADELKGNLTEESFTARGNVELTGTDAFLTGEELFYDRIAGEVIVKGRPYLEYQDIKARADQIRYYTDKNLAYLTGNVSGEQLGHSFSGEKMELDLVTGKMTLAGAAHFLYENRGE
ncbi:LptA/OstA family protein [Halocella sp. SP3-1]|uniref:LptA/OstA family protein n=1 Tax=Halocella sp. SP3-1 TaxID=2382161 RepID=UPI000F75E98D|nr:LptA/OstA family protein [Halocella sp. SP3-1]AZO93972.1 hypothetical protein D7D81_04865 [Halocella sp. SP3-1]